MIKLNNKNYSISKTHYKVGVPDNGMCHCHVFPRTLLEDGSLDKNCEFTSVGFNMPENMVQRKHLYAGLSVSIPEFYNCIHDEVVDYDVNELVHLKNLKINSLKKYSNKLFDELNTEEIKKYTQRMDNVEVVRDIIDEFGVSVETNVTEQVPAVDENNVSIMVLNPNLPQELLNIIEKCDIIIGSINNSTTFNELNAIVWG